MAAAIAAARGGARVRLWEKNHSLGRKLLATGNGRCNFTNSHLGIENYHSQGGDDLSPFMKLIDNGQTRKFFHDLGVEPWEDERGRCFPQSQEAAGVLAALCWEMERLGVEVRLRSEIVSVEAEGPEFRIHQRGERHRAKRVIIACGGNASPQFGANGSGFELARRLGHTITGIFPSLVPWEIAGNWFHSLQGIRWEMELTLIWEHGQKETFTDEGLFTRYGLSGPLALRSSRSILGGVAKASLNFLPGWAAEKISGKLSQRARALAQRAARDFLTGLLPQRLGRMLLRESGIAWDDRVDRISESQMARLRQNIVDWPIRIKGLRPFKEAQVTAGGVALKEIQAGTLESKIVPGLFFCGEVVDIDGDSGGYNLEWCWSSGRAAGRAAAQIIA